ncbi:hypothetical protein ACLB2K_033318 [Fragaria x ananassa]
MASRNHCEYGSCRSYHWCCMEAIPTPNSQLPELSLGVGMASMTAPLYISEASPHRIRGALVSTNGLLITRGQFLSYLINLAFTKTPGTWRWMVGVAGLPAVVQFILMKSLPESPRWLYRDNKADEARAILAKIYPAEEVDDELKALQESVEFEKSEEGAIGKTMLQKVKSCFGNTVFAGFASNQTAMALSLVTSGLNVVGTLISMCFVDRYGRRRLMIISMFGIISCLIVLAGVFYYAASHSPTVSHLESNHFGTNTTCPAYVSAPNPAAWDCMTCLKYTDCAFCSIRGQNLAPGACLAANDQIRGQCRGEHRVWYSKGCPSKIGTGGGIAAVSNWTANLIVSETLLTLTKELGSAGTFLLFAGFSTIGLIFIYFLVPETKGMQFEEVEKLLEKGFRPKLFAPKDTKGKQKIEGSA